MILLTINAKKIKLFIFIKFIVIVIALIVMAIIFSNKVEQNTPQATDYSYNNARILYLNHCGWDVDTEPITEKIVTIPYEFNQKYTEYNNLQKQQGFDLEEFKGKKVVIYTYNVKNYRNSLENVCASVIIYKDEIVGGEIYQRELDGFMHGLRVENNE